MSSTNAFSDPSRANFILDHGGENSACLELGKLRENAGLGSGGEGHGAVDQMTFDDACEMDDLLVWFLVHVAENECVGIVANILVFE